VPTGVNLRWENIYNKQGITIGKPLAQLLAGNGSGHDCALLSRYLYKYILAPLPILCQ
jgi:hypothetical protein